jgi:flagellar M-ring protein FliF
MRDDILRRLQALQRGFASFTTGQKTIAVIGGLALVFAAVLVFRWAATPSYAPLFTNLAPADASAIVDKLDAAGTPYQLSDGGGTVLVPQSQVYAARIKLSGEGLPSQGSTGYSLLDNQSLSTSQFQEQTTYKRAIEGELEKTIEALDAVDTAVVHVAIPQEKLFASDQQPVTASVLVKTQPGTTLDASQVQAIVHLVASSVEGLDPKQVTVADSTGQVLSTAGDGVDSIVGTRDQQVQDFQDQMKAEVQGVLDRVLGPGNSAVDVTADLNFDQTVTDTTRYFSDPQGVPLSGSTTTETYKGPNAGAAGGVVGPNGQFTPGTTTGNGSSAYSKKQKTSDNAVSKTVEHRQAAPGNVQSLHVGIVMDARSVGAITAAQVQKLVSSALGIDPKRGDTVQVSVMPFDRSQEKQAAAQLAQAQAADHKAALMTMAKNGGLALLVALVLLLAWLNGRKRRKVRDQATSYVVEQLRRRSEPEPTTALPPTPPALEMSGPDPAELRMVARDEIAAMVERQPEEVAQLLRGWLVEAEH